MDLLFKNSKNSTVGMELEMRILSKDSYDVKNCADIIFSSIPNKLKPHIHKELLKSMFEIVTPVCKDVNEAVDFIDDTIKKITKIGKKNDFVISALATHPFEKKEDNEINIDPRYESFKKEFQIIIKNFLISGLHIHVGINSKKNAIKAYNSVINYIPLFLAFSANSPFFHAEDTGLKSYRTKVFDKLPRAGIPEYFNNYKEYTSVYKQLFKTNTIKISKDIWWDVRISPGFGTLELRVCDAFYNKKRLKFLGIFYQAIVEYSKIKHPKKEFHQINMQNKWSATRYGLDGVFIQNGKKIPIRKKINNLIDEMQKNGIFKKLGTAKDMKKLRYLVDKSSPSCKLRDIYNKTNDFKEVIKSQII